MTHDEKSETCYIQSDIICKLYLSLKNLTRHDNGNQLKWHLYGFLLGFVKIIEISICKVSDGYIKAHGWLPSHFVYAYIGKEM